MARLKTHEFSNFLNPLNGEQLQRLIKEAQAALEVYEKENNLERKKDKAIILRNQLHIGSTAWAKIRKEVFRGPVISINADTIKISGPDGLSKNIKILQLIDEKTAKELIANNEATLGVIKPKKSNEKSESPENSDEE